VSQNVTIQVPSVHGNLKCYGFHLWAEDFLSAAKAYGPVARKGSFVGHFLCCQSVELAFKAFLSLKGIERRKLAKKPFGHNLDELAKKSIDRGLSDFVALTAGDSNLVRDASAWYDSPGGKRFQYFRVVDATTAFSGAPGYGQLEALATSLQSPQLRDAVRNA
jgi:hypothetical protein